MLVLEAGKNRSDDPIVQNGNIFAGGVLPPLVYDPKYAVNTNVNDTNFANAFPGNLAFGLAELFSAGRMWGGSSAHNFMLAVRGSQDFWNSIAAVSGNNRFAYNTLLPSMKAVEKFNTSNIVPNPAQRGLNGPLQVTQHEPFNPADPWFVQFNAVTGAPIVPDYNAGVAAGVSVQQEYRTADFTTRSYAVTAFEPATVVNFDGSPVGGRKLRILSEATVTRVIFSGNKAVGVEFLMNNKLQQVFARKKVILSAGCPFSAQILQLSGVGDATNLTNLGIPVVVDNPNVGAGLKTHYGSIVVSSTILSPVTPLAFVDGSPYFAPAVTGQRKIQLAFAVGLNALTNDLLLALNIFNPFGTATSTVVWNLKPRASGTAFIIANSPFVLPEINYNFFGDGDLTDPASDLSATVAGMKIMRDVFGGNATMIYPSAADFAAGDATLAFAARATLNLSADTVTNHYSGTCNMGTVVDSNLNVIGTQNLMVADLSIYPFPEDGNTSWSGYMAGVVAAQILGVQFP